jgi:hypothetical protein
MCDTPGARRDADWDKEVLEVANRATQHSYIVNPIKPFETRAKSMFNTHPRSPSASPASSNPRPVSAHSTRVVVVEKWRRPPGPS